MTTRELIEAVRKPQKFPISAYSPIECVLASMDACVGRSVAICWICGRPAHAHTRDCPLAALERLITGESGGA